MKGIGKADRNLPFGELRSASLSSGGRSGRSAGRQSLRGAGVIDAEPETALVSIDEVLAGLKDLDLDGLRQRWRAVTGRPAAPCAPKFLLVMALAWQIQADTHGALDPTTAGHLDRIAKASGKRSAGSGSNPADRVDRVNRPAPATLASLGIPDGRTGRLQPGCALVREHNGVMHQVMVLKDAFAWNGQTYASLSSVALAITGTNWNGRRFFGIDRRPEQPGTVGEPIRHASGDPGRQPKRGGRTRPTAQGLSGTAS